MSPLDRTPRHSPASLALLAPRPPHGRAEGGARPGPSGTSVRPDPTLPSLSSPKTHTAQQFFPSARSLSSSLHNGEHAGPGLEPGHPVQAPARRQGVSDAGGEREEKREGERAQPRAARPRCASLRPRPVSPLAPRVWGAARARPLPLCAGLQRGGERPWGLGGGAGGTASPFPFSTLPLPISFLSSLGSPSRPARRPGRRRQEVRRRQQGARRGGRGEGRGQAGPGDGGAVARAVRELRKWIMERKGEEGTSAVALQVSVMKSDGVPGWDGR